MKIGLLTTVLCCFSLLANAQNDNLYPTRTIRATIGFAGHGTGDLKGITQGFEFEKYFRKRPFWSIEVGSSIHNGEYPKTYIDQNQKEHDISYRYTVAGIQIIPYLKTPTRLAVNSIVLKLFPKQKKISFGLHTGLQGDTNGDVLFPQFAFSVGRSFTSGGSLPLQSDPDWPAYHFAKYGVYAASKRP